MDGTRSDGFAGGHLSRPPSLTAIVRDYPDVVIGLISGLFQVSSPGAASPDGSRTFMVGLPGRPERQYALREADFLVCKAMAELFSQNKAGPGPVSAFKSEPVQDLRARIAARLRVEFAGRGE